ncbi:MAG: transposase [Bacteroidota bacterium]
MPGDRYTILDQHAHYFLTIRIIKWVDLLTRYNYRDIIVESLNFSIKNKGLEINAWVFMSNHIHLIARCIQPHRMSDFLRDFKKFTSKAFIQEMSHIHESRKDWLLDKFHFEAKRTRRAVNYKIWSDDNHAIDLDNTGIDIMQKINYIHDNPVKARIVNNPEDYVYSSAIDYYTDQKGLVKVVIVD